MFAPALQPIVRPFALAVASFFVVLSAHSAEPTDEVSPQLVGVALQDLDNPVAVAAVFRLREPDMVASLQLGTILSASLSSLGEGAIDIDVVERSPAFTDFYPDGSETYPGNGRRPTPHGHGGVGVTRIRMHYQENPYGFIFHDVEVLARNPITVMDLQVIVSIGDMTMRVEDTRSGFRRVYPLGVGAIDFIRIPGGTSSLTPTTEFGRLDKRGSWEVMTFPKHFQDKPYLPLHIPYPRRNDADPPELSWRATDVAFHIWQPPRFARGFLSHGCVRMRDEDLAELTAFVFGVETHIPIAIRAKPEATMGHPYWKLQNRFWKLKNIGSDSTPKYWIMNGVWVTEYAARTPVPAGDSIIGIPIDPPRLRARFDPGNPPVPKAKPELEPDDGGEDPPSEPFGN